MRQNERAKIILTWLASDTKAGIIKSDVEFGQRLLEYDASFEMLMLIKEPRHDSCKYIN